jgi:transposase-like protein
MKSVLSDKHFHDEAAAYEWVESRIWPEGPVCPHCGGVDRISKMKGKSTRIGAYKCYQCRKPFTVKVGTVFESSHVPMCHWLQAIFLMVSSKKGVSANQLHRALGCTLKTAWFIAHRVREAMRTIGLEPMGGEGAIVEADETFLHDMDRFRGETFHRGTGHKRKVLTLIERGGNARSFHIEDLSVATVAPIVRENIARESALMTDEARHYKRVGKEFASHESVEHRVEEYVRGNVHVNTAESFFSLFKRGMRGVYQHCGEKHLHRYLAEFDFRYNNRVALGVGDVARAEKALSGVKGKRLYYRQPA